ncbi:MAG: methyltransferase domain-containing protein [Anaerolineae bacterium]|nr:methyltransferase domain-containing protein [Anaerolineae bacterium]
MIGIFALTTRGLEAVSADEMAALPGLNIVETAYRRVSAAYEGSPASLLNLRTVDDLYIDIAIWTKVSHTRDMLAVMKSWSAAFDLTNAAEICAAIRPVLSQPLFSVTASFVGRRNYSADEIKQAIAEGVSSQNSWTYTDDDRVADFNIRIFIEHEVAYVGLRLGKSPLHERTYKQAQRAGSLKPSVAAAMLQLSEVSPGHSLLDPCCGAGTILIEGALMGAISSGGDNDPEAVRAARANAAAAKVNIDIHEWDAHSLPIADQSTERIVTNLPWGRQIVVDDELENFYRDVCAETERVLAPRGRIAVLTSTPHLLRFSQLHLERAIEISLFGQTPTIALYSSR